MAAAGLREIGQLPVTVESTTSIKFRTSPKSPAPTIFSRPLKTSALCPTVTVNGPIAVRWSGANDAGSGRSPALVCRTTPRLGAIPEATALTRITSVGVTR